MACERFDKLQRRDFSIQKISLKGSIRPWAVASADSTSFPLSLFLSLFQLSTSFSPSQAQRESQFHISGLDFLLASIRTRSLLYSIFKWQAAAFPLVLVAQMTTLSPSSWRAKSPWHSKRTAILWSFITSAKSGPQTSAPLFDTSTCKIMMMWCCTVPQLRQCAAPLHRCFAWRGSK